MAALARADLLIGAVLIPGARRPQAGHPRHAERDEERGGDRRRGGGPGRVRRDHPRHHPLRPGLRGRRRRPLLRGQHARRRAAHVDPGASTTPPSPTPSPSPTSGWCAPCAPIPVSSPASTPTPGTSPVSRWRSRRTAPSSRSRSCCRRADRSPGMISVPALCVGTACRGAPRPSLRATQSVAPGRSHAERGNENRVPTAGTEPGRFSLSVASRRRASPPAGPGRASPSPPPIAGAGPRAPPPRTPTRPPSPGGGRRAARRGGRGAGSRAGRRRRRRRSPSTAARRRPGRRPAGGRRCFRWTRIWWVRPVARSSSSSATPPAAASVR